MKFTFTVGDKEHHLIEFAHDLFWGKLECKVDDNYVPVEGLPHFLGQLEVVRTFLIGDTEKHEVRIQIIRPLLLAAISNGWKYKVFVDNKEYKTFGN